MADQVHLRIPLHEATLAEAVDLVEDASLFDRTRMDVLYHFNIAPSDYWNLTVRDHAEMITYLQHKGLV